VLEWGARDHPVHVLDLLADGLNSENRNLQLAALRGLETRPIRELLAGPIERCSFGRPGHAHSRLNHAERMKAMVASARNDESCCCR